MLTVYRQPSLFFSDGAALVDLLEEAAPALVALAQVKNAISIQNTFAVHCLPLSLLYATIPQHFQRRSRSLLTRQRRRA